MFSVARRKGVVAPDRVLTADPPVAAVDGEFAAALTLERAPRRVDGSLLAVMRHRKARRGVAARGERLPG